MLKLSRRSARAFFSSSARRLQDITLTVDGRKVTVPAGSALIQAIEAAGVQVPRYCYHEKLAIAGNCRMCLVDLERAPKAVASCAFPAANGQVVHTQSVRAKQAREGVTEFILANHPLDCPVCDQGGECDLQDQSLRYGSDRGRFHEIAGKRAVEDKDFGPLVKTSMNRCIQCTRCIRFANDVAGAPELGSSGRGNEMQIGMYLNKNLNSELSGNVIDLCPVGALTSKPYAFKARPWELKKTETVDVLDGLGSNIRVDSRGQSVMRVLPRINDEVNEEWISDKTRFAVDGLNTQRLTVPLIKQDGVFKAASWEDALLLIQEKLSAVEGNEFKAIAGDLPDVEALVALKDLTNRLGSDNLAHDFNNGSKPLAHGTDFRANYLFNSSITGIEDADVILLVGTNPRHEAAVLNARIRKHWLDSDVRIGLVGEDFKSTFEYENLGSVASDLEGALTGDFGKALSGAKKPLIIVGSSVVERDDADAIFGVLGRFVADGSIVREDWNGYNILQRSASRAGAYDIGFATHDPKVAKIEPKAVWLLGADEVDPKSLPKDAFVIYQGHHGDKGAPLADVILPGAAYTEKASTWVNTEGRAQVSRAAVAPPGAAREDWKIIKAVSDVLGVPLPYETQVEISQRLAEVAPNLLSHDVLEPSSLGLEAAKELAKHEGKPKSTPLKNAVSNFYFTDPISRSSPTMAKSSQAFSI